MDNYLKLWLETVRELAKPYITECKNCGETIARSAYCCMECGTRNTHPDASRIVTLDEDILMHSREEQ